MPPLITFCPILVKHAFQGDISLMGVSEVLLPNGILAKIAHIYMRKAWLPAPLATFKPPPYDPPN